MPRDHRRAHVDWDTSKVNPFEWQHVQVELLMDIREELHRLNGLLACPNFTGIPQTLRRIALNTSKPRRKKK